MPQLSKRVVILIIISVLMLFVTVGSIYLSKKTTQQPLSPHILSITQPVYAILGTVKKINNNIVTLEVNGQNTPIAYQPKSYIVNVIVTEKTTFTKPNILPSYSSLSRTQNSNLTINDIKNGASILITTAVDLRTFMGDAVEAVTISLSPQLRITGTITDVTRIMISIDGVIQPSDRTLPFLPTQLQKKYTIAINDQTEIVEPVLVSSSNPTDAPAEPKQRRVSFEDLKINSNITVYTAEGDLQATSFTAVLVELAPPVLEQNTPIPATNSPMFR